MNTCTRILEFDAAHRITRHESKCKHLHGHRYKVEITCAAPLDRLGMVVDFGLIKKLVGTWIDAYWDHGSILKEDDPYRQVVEDNGHRLYLMPVEPTAENLAVELLAVSRALLASGRLTVLRVRVWETTNCYADAEGVVGSPVGRVVEATCG